MDGRLFLLEMELEHWAAFRDKKIVLENLVWSGIPGDRVSFAVFREEGVGGGFLDGERG